MKKNKISTYGLIDLAQPRLGSKIIYKTDDFFAPAERIINPLEPIWKEGLYDNNGKWMDGWETRRRRDKGYDYIILYLGKPGKINKVNIDTSFFNGNQPDFASIEGCFSDTVQISNKVKWKTILKKVKLKPNNSNIFNIINKNISYSHIRLNIFPDGGVARLRIFGKISTDKFYFKTKNNIELSSILNGSTIIDTNNEHFGSAENILAPGKAINMGDGWETRRRRSKGYDWLIFKLGFPGTINSLLIDTKHFKGNYPDYFNLQASFISDSSKITKKQIIKKSLKWQYLISNEKLGPDREHFFSNLLFKKVVNYVKLNIYPDGGVSRINIFGDISNKK